MKIIKIMTDSIRAYMQQDRIYVGTYGDTVGISLDKACVWFIPKATYPFGVNAWLRGEEAVNWERIVPKDEIHDATLTNEMRLTEHNTTAQKLTNGTIDVWINAKYLKYFDKCAKFKIIAWNRPVVVCENDILVGMIMPLNMKNK